MLQCLLGLIDQLNSSAGYISFISLNYVDFLFCLIIGHQADVVL